MLITLTQLKKWVKYYAENVKLWSYDFIKNSISNNCLKKHPTVDYQFGWIWKGVWSSIITNDAKAVTKEITYDLYQEYNITTGLYAVAGEPFTIQFPKDLSKDKITKLGLRLSIGIMKKLIEKINLKIKWITKNNELWIVN